MQNPFAQITQTTPTASSGQILYAYRLPGDLLLSREELLSRGVPNEFLTLRSGSQALRLAFSQDNDTAWSLTGKGRSFRLHDPEGVQAASISFAPGSDLPRIEFREDWWEYYSHKQGWNILEPNALQVRWFEVAGAWNKWILERVQFYRGHVDRQNIQRSFERWLSDAGAEDECIPSLKIIAASQEQVLARASAALPEADWKFWRLA